MCYIPRVFGSGTWYIIMSFQLPAGGPGNVCSSVRRGRRQFIDVIGTLQYKYSMEYIRSFPWYSIRGTVDLGYVALPGIYTILYARVIITIKLYEYRTGTVHTTIRVPYCNTRYTVTGIIRCYVTSIVHCSHCCIRNTLVFPHITRRGYLYLLITLEIDSPSLDSQILQHGPFAVAVDCRPADLFGRTCSTVAVHLACGTCWTCEDDGRLRDEQLPSRGTCLDQ